MLTTKVYVQKKKEKEKRNKPTLHKRSVCFPSMKGKELGWILCTIGLRIMYTNKVKEKNSLYTAFLIRGIWQDRSFNPLEYNEGYGIRFTYVILDIYLFQAWQILLVVIEIIIFLKILRKILINLQGPPKYILYVQTCNLLIFTTRWCFIQNKLVNWTAESMKEWVCKMWKKLSS